MSREVKTFKFEERIATIHPDFSSTLVNYTTGEVNFNPPPSAGFITAIRPLTLTERFKRWISL